MKRNYSIKKRTLLLSSFVPLLVLAYFTTSALKLVKTATVHRHKNTQQPASPLPNILLIVSEDNNQDLGCYGVPYVKTPVLDSLAKRGVRFENSFVTYSVCSPSRGTLFTGLFPHQNGQIGLATHKYHLYPGVTTLPVYLKPAGYRVGCIGKIHVAPDAAFDWDFRPPKGSPLLGENFARKDFLKYTIMADSFFRQSAKPFFLMINYPDAHAPWMHQVAGMPKNPINGDDIKAPLNYIGANSKHLRGYVADYYNCMSRLDDMIGQLFEKLKAQGKDKNTVIIYMADHGAEFSRGKFSNYDSGLKVPLIVYWPGLTKAGSVRKELVSSIDILPTIMAAARRSIPDSLPGKSLVPLLKGTEVKTWRQYVYAETEGSFPHAYYPRSSVRDERYKLIHNLLYQRENPEFQLYAGHGIEGFEGGTEEKEIAASGKVIQRAYATWRNPPEYELYDIKTDPNEFNDLSKDAKHAATLKRLKGALADWQRKTRDPLADKTILARYTAEVDSIVKTHPKMDDAKDKSYVLNYATYFMQYRNRGKK
jgi:N-sulfoglucosamine sulfohydrolase